MDFFYASALKLLKQEFGNPLMVSDVKLKDVLELLPVQHDDQNSLRNYQGVIQKKYGRISFLRDK